MEQAPETEYNDDLINKYGDKTFSIKLSDIGLEIMKTDLGKMDWDKAKKECENLGDGWRLPTIDELKSIYDKKDEIGGFKKNEYYWSRTEYGKFLAWGFYFSLDDAIYTKKYFANYVRAVRDLK
jgi:hypothetical protein